FAGVEASCNGLLPAAAWAWPGCRSKLMLSDTAPTRATRLSSERIRLRLECRAGCISKPSLCYTLQLNTRLLHVQSRALSRPASAETRGSKNHAYGRWEGSQRQEQEGSDRVKGGLRCELASRGFYIKLVFVTDALKEHYSNDD